MNRFRWLNRLRRIAMALLALFVCAALTGCGPRKAEVTGTVRYNGKPLTSGTIQFLGPDGVPCSGTIQPDGTFSVQVPVGLVKVIVSCVDESRLNRFTARSGNKHDRAAPPPSAEKVFLIPPRYADWNTSGLTVLVEHDKTVTDFALTSN